MKYDCRNLIEITGNSDIVDELNEYVATSDSPFSFSKIMPIPLTSEQSDPLHQAYQYVGETIHNTHLFFVLDTKGFIKSTREVRPDQLAQLTNFETNCKICWCIENWGCKWEPNHVDPMRYANFASYVFFTPSTPPYGIIKALRGRYPGLNIAGTFRNEQTDKSGFY